MQRTVLLLAFAAMLALAGCASTAPNTGASPTNSPLGDSTPASGSSHSGTVSLYVSDEPNDIGDFAHLNVTVTEVQLHYVGPTNDTEAENSTAAPETTPAANATATPAANATVTPTPAPDTTVVVTSAEPESDQRENGQNDHGKANDDRGDSTHEGNEKQAAKGDDEERTDGGEDRTEGQARWVTRDVGNTTVDLTELRGANASLLSNLTLPAGRYTQVRLVVDEVHGTLTDGSDQRVKLPSGRMKLNEPFTLGANDTVDFVFDITVHEAGKSGKYVLKPVAGESGTDKRIERADD